MGLFGAILANKQLVQFIQNPTGTVIQLDASLKETHSRSSTATKFPIENGNNISDHIIISPVSLSIDGIISDTPIGGLKGLITEAATTLTSALVPPVGLAALAGGVALFSALSGSKSPSVQAYLQLLQLQENAMPFDVLTTLYRYNNMWIEDLSAPREVENGNALIFTVKLSQLLIVAPQSINISIFANPGLAAGQGDLGRQGLGYANAFQQGQISGIQTAGGTP